MSRVGQMPIIVPENVDVKIKGSHVHVKGPNGELEHTFPGSMLIQQKDRVITINRPSDEQFHRAMHGTTRSLIYNMVVGVSEGFEKKLEVEGIGYRAELKGSDLVLFVGYSHPVEVQPPPGITFEVDNRNREILVRGYDKQVVGEVAANIRKVRPPEPYKGKGIRYQGEYVRRKAGKSGKKI